MIPWLELDSPFPDVSKALTDEDGAGGLLAAGADLSPRRLLDAYRHGIFPWFSENQPILWWSTDPRMVLKTDQFVISSSLSKTLRKVHRSTSTDRRWQVRFDFAFERVMRECAAPRRDGAGTWISEDIVAGYRALHRLGYAHSSEVWLDGKLVSAHLWVSDGRYVHSHLAASNPEGYGAAAAYAVYDASVRHFAAAELLNFGGGAGPSDDPRDGLSRFKKGFANESAAAYICGAILDEGQYHELVRRRGVPPDTLFFPAYRARTG